MKIQGRVILLFLFSSLLFLVIWGTIWLWSKCCSALSWQPALWCWGWGSAFHFFLHQLAPLESHQWEMLKGDWKTGGGTGTWFFLVIWGYHQITQQWPLVLSVAVCSSLQRFYHQLSQNQPHQSYECPLGSVSFLKIWIPTQCNTSSKLIGCKSSFPLFSPGEKLPSLCVPFLPSSPPSLSIQFFLSYFHCCSNWGTLFSWLDLEWTGVLCLP